MGNACATDENKDSKNQDNNAGLNESNNQFRAGNANREEGQKMQNPSDTLNEKYSNNLTPIDELPEITNPNVRMSIDKHGSYVHQSNIDLQQSVVDEPELNVQMTHRFKNSTFKGEVNFPDKQTLYNYQQNDQVEFELLPNAIGTKVFADDSRYEGDFSYGRFHGKGRFIHANGDLY